MIMMKVVVMAKYMILTQNQVQLYYSTQSYLHGEKLESGVKYTMDTDIMYRQHDAHNAKKEEGKQKATQELKEKQAITNCN